MSDYKHEKVVRLPFPEEIMEKFNTDDPWECEEYLMEKLGDLWDNRSKSSFKLGCTDKACYIDWLYYRTYGEESGEYGYVRLLTKKELEVIKPYFDKLEVAYKDEDLRLVNYCYYNCCEPTDYYNISDDDDSHLFISK